MKVYLKKIAVISILLSLSLSISAQSFTLQGKVSDEKLNPIELATVAIVNQGRFTMTNLKGEFTMEAQSADSVVVRFSMIGWS